MRLRVPLQTLVSGWSTPQTRTPPWMPPGMRQGLDDPPESAVIEAQRQLLEEAARPFASNPELRQKLVDISIALTSRPSTR